MASRSLTRVGIYARISTSNHGQDVNLQTRELEQFATVRGWCLVDSYLDIGISGAKDKRPQLDRLMADARRRRFDVVLVYRYDRFARSLRHLVNALEEFSALGIEFVSVHEGVDTTTPNGRLVFGIFASIAEFERELIRDRVKSGLRNARAKGKILGRPRARVDVARIEGLRAQGHTIRAIAGQLGYSRALVYKILSNRVPRRVAE
jgi:DNA invertase Pin-like site-specific DNA recombinase